MLIGSTFAWFTDSVSTGKNRIVAGNLDVQLSYKTGGMTDWRDVETLTPDEPDPFFRGAGGDKILWEPGAIGVTSFKVENVGTLAFKYALALLAVKYNQLDGNDLRDVIKFAVIDGELSKDFIAEHLQDFDYSAFPDFTKRSALLPNDGVDDAGDDQEIFTVVAYWKPNSDSIDNLYNVSNGKIATELDGTETSKAEPEVGNHLYLDIDIRLKAWQDTVEYDSFDNQYDAMADALDTFPDGCYTVTEHENWVELDIYTGRSTSDINISYTGYAPDNTDDRMREWKTDGSGTITPAAANGNTHLIFFKTANKGSFTLTQDERVLPELQINEDGTIGESIVDKSITNQSIADQSRAFYSANNTVAVADADDASEVSAPKVEAKGDVVEVHDEEGMRAVFDELSKTGDKKIVKLTQNIDFDDEEDLSLTNGTLTILGEDYSINIIKVKNFKFTVSGKATLNLGADNYDNGLHINFLCTTGNNLIHVSGEANLNICKNVVIDGKGNATGAGCVGISGTATVNMLGGTIQNCVGHVRSGGGFAMAQHSTLNMWSGEIKNCSSLNGGGAVGSGGNPMPGSGPVVFDTTFNMYGGTISGCSGRWAGAIYLTQTSKFNMIGGTIENCKGTPYCGGVYVGGESVFNMSKVATIENCTGSYGGAVFMSSSSSFEMSDRAKIESCQSSVFGGGVYMQDYTRFKMSGGTIESCKSEGGGAAVCMLADDDALLYDLQFTMDGGSITGCITNAENAEDDVYGGTIYVGAGTVKLNKGEITGNRVEAGNGMSAYGGGICSYYSDYKTEITIEKDFKLYDNKADTAGDDIAKIGDDVKLTLGNVNTEVELSDGYPLDGWYIDDPDNRWGSENYSYEAMKIEAGETTAQFIKAAHGEIAAIEGIGTPGRLLDLYDGEDSSALISKGGAKTVRWNLKNSDLANCVSASAPIKAGTKITMAYRNADPAIVNYYYLIVRDDTTTISLSDFTAMGGSERFVLNTQVRNPLYQFSFVFPETQENMNVWMSNTTNDDPNGSEVSIAFSENRVSVPSGTLETNGTTVTVSGLTGFTADQSDSRHNTTPKPLADRKAVLAIEAVDAQGRNVAMSSDTVVTVGGDKANVSAGIAAVEITADGIYTINVDKLPQGAEIRVSLCYTYNNVIYKPMSNVLNSVTVEH